MNASPLPDPPRHPVHILYAEDLPVLREVMRQVVDRQGNHLELASDGVEAAERLASQPDEFDLLITDHQMPYLNGVGLVRRAREMLFKGKIAVLSSQLSEQNIADYVALGVDLILFKPLLPRTLDRAVQQLFPGAGLFVPLSAA